MSDLHDQLETLSRPPCRCIECGCEDFISVHSEVLPGAPVVLEQCEQCGEQYSTGVLPWLQLPMLPGVEKAE